jgi:hypothetical protein
VKDRLDTLTLDASRTYQSLAESERVYDVPKHLSPMS